MKRLLLAVPLCLGFSGCATHNATTLIKALKNDAAGFSFSVDSVWAKVRVSRANPDGNTPPYRLSPDGGVQVLEQTQGAAPAASPNEIILQTLRKVPNQPEVQ